MHVRHAGGVLSAVQVLGNRHHALCAVLFYELSQIVLPKQT